MKEKPPRSSDLDSYFLQGTYKNDKTLIKALLFGGHEVTYQANGEDTGIVDETYNFFNPKAGVTFDLDENNNFYLSYSVANREPNRNDFEDGSPKPERLDDF